MSDLSTPMMNQYRGIKRDLPQEAILFFRLGDFYEMFFDDAKEAASILEIALTKRNGVPMCGVPFHAVESYLAKLIRAGRKVAICEQVEDAGASRGIVRREVTRIVTPGTVVEDNILASNSHNFLAGITSDGPVFGLALLDLSTGLFRGEEYADAASLADALRRAAPSECIVPESLSKHAALWTELQSLLRGKPGVYDDWVFEHAAANDLLIRHFGVHSLAGFGCDGRRAAVGAAGGVLYYVKEELRRNVGHVRSFSVSNSSDVLILDEATSRNLDLVPVRGSDSGVALLKTLDATRTAMGARLMREWLLCPSRTIGEITRRHDAVQKLCDNRSLLRGLREALTDMRDMERMTSRVQTGSGNARDVLAIGQSLAVLPQIKDLMAGNQSEMLAGLADILQPLPELTDLIVRALVEQPPLSVKEGGLIRDGYDARLDEFRSDASSGRNWLAEYQASEQARTGIKTLKVRHNRVFGYYIEISKALANSAPPEYTRKQTLVNAERFSTPELKEYEDKILGAQDRAVALEHEIFLDLRDKVLGCVASIQRSATAVAGLDVLASLADRSLALGYVRPRMTEGEAIVIRDGRHPVVECIPDMERFVPNDTLLDCRSNQLAIITGPNMAGKSTYIRQVALIVIMAHMGCFVPAGSAEICLVDRVFTRVGASDDLSRGRSTFMVEMQETANILNNATARSLIVLDEIGRGTSTFDGISIAWAVAEHLHNCPDVKAKTLFATHYHELTDLALAMRGVKNYNVLVREQGERVVFLRKIVPGGADKSYGILVARLAGMPDEVIGRAREILSNLEEGEFGDSGQPKIARTRVRKPPPGEKQLDLF